MIKIKVIIKYIYNSYTNNKINNTNILIIVRRMLNLRIILSEYHVNSSHWVYICIYVSTYVCMYVCICIGG